MRIRIKKENLLEKTQLIIGVIENKNTLPILSNILIESAQNELKLTTTDLDIGMSISTQTDVIEEGSITTPGRRFIEVIKELPEKEIEIYTKKNNAVFIECEGIAFKLLGVPKEEFPKLPAITEKEQMVLQQATTKKMLRLTSFAMSHDETRYALNGTCFITTKDYIRMVATDGRRLAIATQPNKTDFKHEKKIIIPTKTVQELVRALRDEGDVGIVFSKNQAIFRVGGLLIISRLIEGDFPNYEQAIPKESQNRLVVEQESLLSATKRASILTTPESQAIRLQLQKNRLTVSKATPEIGEVKEEIDAEYGGEEFVVGFNPAYLLDVLKNIDSGKLNIELAGPDKPAAIRIKDEYLYIVLPMQTT